MGNRRFSRKRLYEVEKAGQSIDLESGAGAVDMIKSATQHRNGNEIVTEIAIDLGSEAGATSVVGGGGNNQAIGLASKKADITRLTLAKFGRITEVRCVVVEASAAACNIVVGSDSVNTGAAPSGVAELCAAVGVTAGADVSALSGTITGIDSNGTQTDGNEWYLYIANDGHGGGGNLSAGKFLIYIHGFAAPEDLV
tara:strand:- start:767 stop:1357 length:591 start_codon:yes stop_codon:yes gene_type:complete